MHQPSTISRMPVDALLDLRWAALAKRQPAMPGRNARDPQHPGPTTLDLSGSSGFQSTTPQSLNVGCSWCCRQHTFRSVPAHYLASHHGRYWKIQNLVAMHQNVSGDHRQEQFASCIYTFASSLHSSFQLLRAKEQGAAWKQLGLGHKLLRTRTSQLRRVCKGAAAQPTLPSSNRSNRYL